MLGFIEYLGVPEIIGIVIISIFFVSQLVGEILELKGKVVPEFLKVRKLFKRKKAEREAVTLLPELLEEHKVLMADNKQVMADYRELADKNKELMISNCEMLKALNESNDLMREIKSHYSADNIARRDDWMKEVNDHISSSDARIIEQDKIMKDLSEKLDRNNADTLSILIDNKRNYLLSFMTQAVDMKCPLTKEQYQRFFNVHHEYEKLIEENKMVNGQVDTAYDLVTKSFEERVKKHAFVEEGWYDI